MKASYTHKVHVASSLNIVSKLNYSNKLLLMSQFRLINLVFIVIPN